MLLLAIVVGLVAVKATLLFLLGRWWGLQRDGAVRLGLVISQGGEFAFVLFAAGAVAGAIGSDLSALLTLAVTLSMAATPLLLLIDDRMRQARKVEAPQYETPPGGDGHVIIAGFGRFGQIAARILRARRIPFTALDSNIAQVDFVKRFGAQIYYGDAGTARYFAGGAGRQGARLCARDRRYREFASGRRDRAAAFPGFADLCARAETAPMCTN